MGKTEFNKSMDFIFSKTAERIRSKAKILGKNAYQVLGYESGADKKLQEELNPSYNKLDVDTVRKVLRFEEGKERNIKKMKFLIPNRYLPFLVSGLDFQDIHEMLWGTEREINEYGEELFERIYEDGLLSNNPKISGLFSNVENTLPVVNGNSFVRNLYKKIENQFIQEFIDFTKAVRTYNHSFRLLGTEETIVDIKEAKEVNKEKDPWGTSVGDYLSFKGLDGALERFTERRLLPLIALALVEIQASQDIN